MLKRGLFLLMRDHFWRNGAAYLVLIISLIPSVLASYRVQKNVAAGDLQWFNHLVEETQGNIDRELRRAVAVLDNVHGFFAASEEVTPVEWQTYIRAARFQGRNPGLVALGFFERLQESELDEHLARRRGQGIESDETERGLTSRDYFPLVHLTAFMEGVNLAPGMDAGADPVQRVLLEEALQSGMPTVFNARGIVPASAKARQGLLIYAPVFRPARDQSAPEESALAGYAIGAFHLEKLLAGISPPFTQLVGLRLYDGGQLTADSLLFDNVSGLLPDSPEPPRFERPMRLSVLNRDLSLLFTAQPGFAADSPKHLPLAVLFGGLTVSLLLFGITLLEAKGRLAAEQLNANIRESEEIHRKANAELKQKIDEKEKAEALLAHERHELRALLDNIPDRVYFKDLQSRFIRSSNEVLQVLKLRHPDELIGKTDFDFHIEEHAAKTFQDEQEIIRTGQPKVGMIEKELWPDGQITWVLTTKMPFYDQEGKIAGTFGTSKDITALKNSQEALANEKERLAVTLRSIADGVISTDTAGTILLFNKVAEDLTGWIQSEALCRPLIEVFRIYNEKTLNLCADPVEQALNFGQPAVVNQDVLLIARDGVRRIISHSASPIRDKNGQTIGVVLVFRDETEKHRLEMEMLKVSKLESVGLLAGGIAHDFNNVLTTIIGNLALAKLCAHSTDLVLARVRDAEEAANRARELTLHLLTFAKGGEPIKKAARLSSLIRSQTELALRGSNIQAEYSLPPDLPPVEVDEGQIGQVINNLVINAREAMPDGGKVEMRAENVQISEGFLPPLPSGNYIKVSVRDYGQGISPEHIFNIFDPYFTTKQEGTGMGLATAYSVIRKHNGQIKVESAVSSGSIFTIYLPVLQDVICPEPEPPQPTLFGQGRILLMDDEEGIRKVAGMMLDLLGYEHECVRDGNEAIDSYLRARSGGRPFNAVIMDLTIPNGMGGKETIRRLKELDPEIKAIVSSGYSYDPVMGNYTQYGFSGVVPKPYKLEDLSQALQTLLQTQTFPARTSDAPISPMSEATDAL
jgi:PAS domain S-box-containing protein